MVRNFSWATAGVEVTAARPKAAENNKVSD
jgi:hypothetical protein